MKKLNKNSIDLIRRAIDIATTNDITNIKFKDGKIAGYSAENGIFILQDTGEQFDFPPLALSRLDTLKKRLSLVDNLSDYEVIYDDDSEKIIKLTFKNKRTKVEFRCADPESVKSPSKVNDPVWYSFDMDDETLIVLNKITTAMDTKTVSLIGKKTEDNLLLKVQDENGDILEHKTDSKLSWYDEGLVDEFNFVFSSKRIARLIKDAVSANFKTVKITKRGFLITHSKGLTVYTISEV